MIRCTTKSPMKSNHKLQVGIEELVDKERYQRLVERLIYLSRVRHNIAFSIKLVSQLCKILENPTCKLFFYSTQYEVYSKKMSPFL